MSFRMKIILGGAAIQAVLLVSLIWAELNTLTASNTEALLARANTTTKLFASTTQAAVLTTDLASLESFVKEVLSNPGVVYARVLSNHGVLAEGGDKHALARKFVADTSLASVANDGVFDASADILVVGEKYGRIEMGFSTHSIQQVIADSRLKSFTLAFLNLVLVGLFSWALGVYLTRGLNNLQQGTQQIAEGALGYQINVRGRDELSQTVTAFNVMSSKLKRMDEERAKTEIKIQQLNHELEQRVVERTVQLQDANKQIGRAHV